jgi:hypothetical protein
MDPRKKKVLVVLSIGSAILVWRVSVIFMEYMPSAAQATPANLEIAAFSNAGQDVVPEATAEMERLRIAQAETMAKPWGRDPFADVPGMRPKRGSAQPVETVSRRGNRPPEAPALRFSGVSKSGEQWLAVIGGDIVRVGDVVNETFTVAEITKNTITLSVDGWLIQYRLGSEEPTVHQALEKS